MNYIDVVAARIGSKTWASDEPRKPEDMRLLRIYAVLCLSKGLETTNEDVHDAWAAWISEYAANHKSLVPFNDLRREVQELDSKYRDAIHEVAKEIS